MDIDRLARRASEQLAARPSRRGIVKTLAVGTGVIVAKLQRYEEAAGQTIGSTCCTGARPCHSADRCDRGSQERWSWSCYKDGIKYWCHDCNKGQTRNYCVFTTRG